MAFSLGLISDKPKLRVVAVIPCFNTASHIAEVLTTGKNI